MFSYSLCPIGSRPAPGYEWACGVTEMTAIYAITATEELMLCFWVGDCSRGNAA